MNNLIRLENRSIIEVSGPEARDFLQGILTNDIAGAQSDNGIYAGLLTPQGKLLFDFFIVKHEDSYLVDVDKGQVDDLVKRLMFYKLRAEVELTVRENAFVCVSLAANIAEMDESPSYADPRFEQMGFRGMMLEGQMPEGRGQDCVANPDKWLAHRILHGIPEAGADYTHGNCFPHDIAMDQLNGIGFKKGCYVGQEVVSRMQHRGTARKRPMIVTSTENLPGASADIRADGSLVGHLGSVFGKRGIAQIRLDRASKALANGVGLSVDGISIELLTPQWADYGEEFRHE